MDRWRTKLRVIHHPPSIFISNVSLFNSCGYKRVEGIGKHDFRSCPVRVFKNKSEYETCLQNYLDLGSKLKLFSSLQIKYLD